MKKLLAMLLAIVMTLSIGSVVAFAQGEPQIVIDGVKDEAYSDKRIITYDYWNFYDNNGQLTFDPLDTERVMNTVWFTWDDENVYLYFQCESKDDLYQPAADELSVPNFDEVFYEMAQIYLDTAPSKKWEAPCIWANTDGNGDTCAHIACNCRGGEGSYYRLMARANPAWGEWNDYFANAAGMFMDFETFTKAYTDQETGLPKEGYEDMAKAYADAHGNGNGQAVSFIDHDNDVFGFELKFPRNKDEDHFQFNIRTRVNEKEWEEEGPELPYTLSFCPAWWLNSDELLEIYFEDYENEDVIDPAVAAIQRKIAVLPAVEELTLDHKDAVAQILADVEALAEGLETQFTEEESAWLFGATVAMAMFQYIDDLGDINGDDLVNANDALMALKASVNKVTLDEEQLLRAEVDGNEGVNAKDALEILQFAVKKRTEFSIVKALTEVE